MLMLYGQGTDELEKILARLERVVRNSTTRGMSQSLADQSCLAALERWVSSLERAPEPFGKGGFDG